MESTPRDEMVAYVSHDGTRYPTYDALVEADANGWVAVAIIARPVTKTPGKTETWPWVIGPFATKREANNARNRLRAKWKRDKANPEYANHTATFAVRPAWKDTNG